LGYEIWVPAEHAGPVYEAILIAGQPYGLKPCGLDAMDITRIEAGFIMNGVDYYSANHCIIDARKTSPFEIGLGWSVQLDRDPFIGQRALRVAKQRPRKLFVGLEVDWVELEREFAKHDLPPEVTSSAWRDGKPIYSIDGEFIGQATSGAWSPTLKKNLALGQVKPQYATPGTEVRFEITVEYERVPIKATVCKTPFYNPERKRI
jgi:aminomethyltransferase